MQQSRPAQTVAIVIGEPELLGQHVGVDANPLGVSARAPVVRLQGRGQGQDRRRVRGFARTLRILLELGQPPFQLANAAGLAGDREPRRGAVGKEHRELEEHDERQEPPPQPLHRDDDDDGHGQQDREQRQPSGRGAGRGEMRPKRQGDGEGDPRRHDQDEQAEPDGEDRTGSPAIVARGPMAHDS